MHRVVRAVSAALAAAAGAWGADVTLSAMLTAPRVEPEVTIPGRDLATADRFLLSQALTMRGAGVLVRLSLIHI